MTRLGHLRSTVRVPNIAANQDGLRFAVRLGFVEHDRYVLDGDTAEWVDLHLDVG